MAAFLEFHQHPRLARAAFRAKFSAPLGGRATPAPVLALLRGEVVDACPLPAPTDALRGAVRDLLRCGGYKPTGRGKPSSEYLARVAAEGGLDSINVAVDVCNVVSLYSGFPISVIDLARATAPLSVAIAGEGRYVFNASGQELDYAGLLVLADAEGPCANAVKDAQRTKTNAATRETLTVIWAPLGFDALLAATLAWSQRLLTEVGVTVTMVV
jgi:hypothetical protein